MIDFELFSNVKGPIHTTSCIFMHPPRLRTKWIQNVVHMFVAEFDSEKNTWSVATKIFGHISILI